MNRISRYGVRVIPDTQPLIADLTRRQQLVQGPHIEEFEAAFARHFGSARAVTTSCGRMAFYYLLKAMDLAPGGEVIVPAFTFWVVPELVRAAGFTPVFADVDPSTFNITTDSIRRVITRNTVAVVPTHLWGLPCDMDEIVELAREHDLRVIEDCAETLGATYKGRHVGTIGDAGFYSLQTIKPLNTYNGGIAVSRDPAVLDRVAAMVEADPWPDERTVQRRLLRGRVVRNLVRPEVFRWTLYPVLRAGSRVGFHPDVYFWEKIRPLSPIPLEFRQRYSNVQAAIGLEGLKHFDEWTSRQQANAARLTAALRNNSEVRLPEVPPDRTHIFYQYCVYVPSPREVWHRCLRRGVDLEALHVDNCTELPIFEGLTTPLPGAAATADALQIPVYSSLSVDQIDYIAAVVADAVQAPARPEPATARA